MDHLLGGCVGNVAGGVDRAARDEIREETRLDDAGGVRRETQQEHHVDQRGMVGDDELAGPAQFRAPDEFIAQYDPRRA